MTAVTVAPQWSTACPDWGDRLKRRQSIIPPPIYADQAQAALAIFKELRVVDLPGRPTFGECADQWVFDFVAAVFGAYDGETGQQLIREFYLLISKKNTKSTIAAGIMLTALILCWREEEEHLILAPTVEVAGNSFKPAAAMVRADEELSALFHVQDHVRTITHRVSRNSLKVVAAESETVSGKKSGKVLVDEHWLFGKRPGAESMFMEALGGQVSRDEGWVIYLTTQSDEAPAGVFKEKLEYFRGVRDGRVHDPRSLGVLYEFPEAMIEAKAYMEPENFHISNPNLGRSVSAAWIADQLRKLEARTDGAFQQFLAKHLNIEIGLRLHAKRWKGADMWPAAARKRTLEELIELSDVLALGIDGGGLDDLLGAAVVGRHAETGEWMHWGKAWAHPIVLERRKSEATKLRDMAAAGELTIIQTIGDDMDELEALGRQLEDTGKLLGAGVDPAGISQIEKMLREKCGIDLSDDGKDRIFGISQGWKLTAIIKTVERMLAQGTFTHCSQALMDWSVGNAMVEPRGNAVLITKAASGTGKIDPLMALFCAAEVMARAPELNVCTDDEVLAV